MTKNFAFENNMDLELEIQNHNNHFHSTTIKDQNYQNMSMIKKIKQIGLIYELEKWL